MDTPSLSAQNIGNDTERRSAYLRVLGELRDHARGLIIPFQNIKYAQVMLRDLKPRFDGNASEIRRLVPELYEEWAQIFPILEWITLNSLREEEIVNLVEKNWSDVYEIPNYDPIEKFKVKCLGMLHEDRDALKARARVALLRNSEAITESGIVRGTREVRGITRNWLMDYNEKLGTGEIDKLQFIQYLTNSQNTQDLNERDRARLETLFSFYEHLKRSSSSLEGMEEEIPFVDENGRLKVFHDGYIDDADIPEAEFRKITQELKEAGVWIEDQTEMSNAKLPMSNQAQVQEPPDQSILASYNTLPIPLDAIRAKTIELKERLAQSPHIVEQILSRPESVKDNAYVVAALVLQVNVMNAKLQMSNVKSMSNVPMRAFIRDILETKLDWSAEDSAKLGIRIGNLLGEPYKGWAVYNKTTQLFEWSR